MGRHKVHKGGKRWKRRLQTGRVGQRLYTLISFWQLFNLCFGFLQELWRFSGRPVWSAGFRMSAGTLAVRRWPPDHRGRNHEHLPVLDQRGWRSDLLSGFRFCRYLIIVRSYCHCLATVTSLTASGELWSLQQHIYAVFFLLFFYFFYFIFLSFDSFCDLLCSVNSFPVEELATPPLDGIILPGVTRQSILEITRKWVRQTLRASTCINAPGLTSPVLSSPPRPGRVCCVRALSDHGPAVLCTGAAEG